MDPPVGASWRASANSRTSLLKRVSCSTTPSRLPPWPTPPASCAGQQRWGHVGEKSHVNHLAASWEFRKKRQKCCWRSDLTVQQLDPEHIQDVSDVADHRCKHRRTPGRSARLSRHTALNWNGVLHRSETSFGASSSTHLYSQLIIWRLWPPSPYLRHGLELTVCMVHHIHQSTDGLRGVKVFCQCFHHAGFSLGQSEGTREDKL